MGRDYSGEGEAFERGRDRVLGGRWLHHDAAIAAWQLAGVFGSKGEAITWLRAALAELAR